MSPAKSKTRDDEDDPDKPWPRPRANPDLVGHEEAERRLADTFKSGRLAHAWLITGPRGVGKATLAYRFARHVLKDGAEAAGPGLFGALPEAEGQSPLYVSPEDAVFRRVRASGHADLLTVERTVDDKGRLRREVIVDDARDVGQFLSLTPAEGGWRIVVVDAVDEMNRNAANAILKVVEEPPARSLVLLVAHNPGTLLPTIRSRCQTLKLKPLDDALVASGIRRYLPDVTPEDAAELAALAEGSIGRALALWRDGGLELHRELEGVLATLPDLDRARALKLGETVGKGADEGAFRTVGELLFRWLASRIRGAATAREGAENRAAGLERLLDVWDKMTRLIERTEAVNLDRKQVTLDLFLLLGNAVRR